MTCLVLQLRTEMKLGVKLILWGEEYLWGKKFDGNRNDKIFFT